MALRFTSPEKGKDPELGFDCSGFVWHVLNDSGLSIPTGMRGVNQFFDEFGIAVHRDAIKPADLVFFSWGGVFPQHVGIVSDYNHYIHAHTGDGRVKCSTIRQMPIKNPSVDAIYLHNPIGFKTLTTQTGRWRYRI